MRRLLSALVTIAGCAIGAPPDDVRWSAAEPPPSIGAAGEGPITLLRRNFVLGKGARLVGAYLRVEVDGAWDVAIHDSSGELVRRSGGPNPGRPTVVDLGAPLGTGVQTLSISVGRSPGAGFFRGELLLEFADGPPWLLLTDRHWRSAMGAEPGWREPSFDDRGWAPAVEIPHSPTAPGPSAVSSD